MGCYTELGFIYINIQPESFNLLFKSNELSIYFWKKNKVITLTKKNVKHRSEVFDTIIFDNTTAKHYSYLGHSVVGSNCNIAAGTITADYRHDGKNHITLVKGQKIDTGRRKLGSIIADNVNTGINTSIYPGRNFFPNTNSKPGEVIINDVKDEQQN